MKNFLKLTAFCLFLIPTLTVQAQTVHKFSAKECADYAAKNNVQVKNALLDLQIQFQSNRMVAAAALPSISAGVGFVDNIQIGLQYIPPGQFGPNEAYFQFGTKYLGTGSIDLSQVLFDGSLFVGLKARKSSTDLRAKAVDVTEENIRANIYKIYYQLVVGAKQIELLDSNISRFAKLKGDTRKLFDAGFAENIDIDKVEVTLVNLQTEKSRAENMINSGLIGLKFLMGMPTLDSLVLSEDISEDGIKSGLGEVAYSYNNRNDYQLLEITQRLNEFNIKRYKLASVPTLRLAANHTQTGQRLDFDFFESGKRWLPSTNYSIRLHIPIFDGFSRVAQVNQAQLELQKTLNSVENLKLNIDTEVSQAKYSYTTSIVAIDAQKKNMQLAEKVYDQTKKKFEAGTGSNIEINAAQTELKSAQTNYISALYDAIIARVDYLKATGKLQ
ncbi:MAG: TolC family protein [Saprospiraceae bacterium]